MTLGMTLLCLSFALYLIVFGGLRIYHLHPSDQTQKSFMEVGLLSLSLILGNCFLSLFFPEIISFRFWGISGIALFCSILLEKQKNTKIKGLLQYLLCLTVILCFSFPEQISILECVRMGGLSLFWFISWRLFVFFDRFSFVSFILTMAWGLGLIFIGFIMRSFPLIISIQALFVSVILTPLTQWQMKQKKLYFGSMLASFVGFLWGGMLAYFSWKGNILQALSFWGYYLFEGIFLITALVMHRPLNTLLDRAISKGGQKALKTLFLHILLLTIFMGILLANSLKLWGLILGVIFIDLYLKLKAIIQPAPSWREVFADAKMGVTELLGKKDKCPPKKISQKKSTKRKAKK